MRKSKYILFLVLSAFVLCESCKKDFLNTQPLDQFSEEAVWTDPVLAQSFVNGIYKRLWPSIIHWYMWDASFVDESTGWYCFNEFQNCLITADGVPCWEGQTWSDYYLNIRACNVFFQNYKRLDADQATLDLLKGQVHFMRAFNYQTMVDMHGGVPIIKQAYGLNDSFLVARSSYADCIDFIVADCDSAASLLPEVQTGDNIGMPTKGAALALKSRVLLHAASDLHNTTMFSGFSNPELLGYVGGDRTARWQAAKDAAKAVIDLNLYQLYKGNPAPGDNIAQNLVDRYLSKTNEEDIWVRFFVSKSYENYANRASGPNGFYGFAHNTPTGDLVDSYEMIDGTKFDWNNPAHALEPYKNRDPRLSADIHYEGAPWRKRSADVISMDPVGQIQIGDKEVWRNGQKEIVFGLDGKGSPIKGYIGTHTGYYLRKFMDPSYDADLFAQEVPWRYLRYAEVLLNMAEACIELHQDDEAKTYLDMIRKRAGMPDITETGDALKERYRHERRIELAFEEHRFYDVRRWMIAPEVYKPISGVSILYKMNPDHTTATIPTITSSIVQNRSWQDKAYFFPILRDEMNKNSLLVQNPGY